MSLAAPPGPVLARMAIDASSGRRLRAAAVGLGASTADAVFFVLVSIGLLAVRPDRHFFAALALLGVIVLCVFARDAWRVARSGHLPPPAARSGFAGGFVLAASSPFNWAWWATSGAGFLLAYGPGLAAGFFPGILLVAIASVFFFAWLGKVSSRVPMYVSYASCALLLFFALVLAYHGIEAAWAGPA